MSLLPWIEGESRRGTAGNLMPTGPLAAHPRGATALRKVRYARRFFPELDDLVLRIGLTRRAAGFADLEGQTLWLNPTHLSLHTISHELVHLLQGRGLVPGGERSCDLYALARDVSLADALPYYLRLPAGIADGNGWLRPGAGPRLHRLARGALARRAAGHRTYIHWFETEAERLGPLAATDRRDTQRAVPLSFLL